MSVRANAISTYASAAWAETIAGLAERHRERRADDVGSRWPLAHDCSVRRRGTPPSPDHVVAPRQAFCCRALA